MSRTRRTLAAAIVVGLATASVVTFVQPSLAGSTERRLSSFTFGSSTGSIETNIVTDLADASPMGLHDYVDAAQADYVYAAPAADEPMRVSVLRKGHTAEESMTCQTGKTHYYSGMFVGGNNGDWANLPEGGTAKVRVRLNCTTANNTVHHLHWAEHRLSSTKWMTPAPTANCVTLTRRGEEFLITTDRCVVQDEIVSWKPGKQLATSDVTAEFTATVSRGALLSR